MIKDCVLLCFFLAMCRPYHPIESTRCRFFALAKIYLSCKCSHGILIGHEQAPVGLLSGEDL